MILAFTDEGWQDYQHWVNKDRSVLKRVNTLIEAILRDPFAGIGKPEQLRHALAGAWSRRVTDEHRVVYRVVDDAYLVILQARGHY